MIRIITQVKDVNADEWSSFVNRHPNGTIFQTPDMYELYLVTPHNTPYIFVAHNKGEIVGVLLSVTITNGKSLFNPFTARSIIIGGPIVKDDNSDVLCALLNEYKNTLRKRVVYSEIRPIYDISLLKEDLLKSGFMYDGHYNLNIILGKSNIDLFDSMHKERKRNVKQAEKYGLIFKVVNDDSSIRKIVQIIENTYSRKSVPLSYSEIFLRAKDILKSHVTYFAAYYGETIIAGQVRLCYKDLVYAWFAGSDDKYFKLRPNDFLMWNVIKWSNDNGYKVFDFGGGGKPGVKYGVRDYKLKYGCELHEYGRYTMIHKAASYYIASTIYNFFHFCIEKLK